jgi:hypothetical protein
MKKIIITMLLVAMGLTYSFAQAKNTNNHNNDNNGYWVVESAKKSKVQTVKFYSEQNELVYEETVRGKINVSDKKVQNALNKILAVMVNQKSYTANKEVIAIYLAKQ